MTTDVSLSSPFGYGKDAWSSPSLASDFETKAKGKTVETERSVRGDRAEIDGRSNCNLANVCQYGGKPKGDGTQGCSCFVAPDCSSTEKCPLGLGGTAKADGTNECQCLEGYSFKLKVGYSKYTVSSHRPHAGYSSTKTYYCWSTGTCTCKSGNWNTSTPSGKTVTHSAHCESKVDGGILSNTWTGDITLRLVSGSILGSSSLSTQFSVNGTDKKAVVTIDGKTYDFSSTVSGDVFNLKNRIGQEISGYFILK